VVLLIKRYLPLATMRVVTSMASPNEDGLAVMSMASPNDNGLAVMILNGLTE
jgi:hypothetical protein